MDKGIPHTKMALLCSLRRRRWPFLRVVVWAVLGIILLVVLVGDYKVVCSITRYKCDSTFTTRVHSKSNEREIHRDVHFPNLVIANKTKPATLSFSKKSLLSSTNKNTLALYGIPSVPLKSASDFVAQIPDDIVQKFRHYDHREYTDKIVILTPIHNVAHSLSNYAKLLKSLTYPHHLISIAFGEDCSEDSTVAVARDISKDLRRASFPRVDVFHFNITGQIKGAWAAKHQKHVQLTRRKHLAQSRNLLSKQGLKDEVWTLWIDSDISELPIDITQQLLSANQDIVVPNCLYRDSSRRERVFDKNTWRETAISIEHQKNLGPNDIMLEGYSQPLRLYLPDLRAEGRVVPIDGVGGCTLLVRADLHRKGLNFPEHIVDHHVETEGLAKLAKRMGFGVYGMPFVNVYHK